LRWLAVPASLPPLADPVYPNTPPGISEGDHTNDWFFFRDEAGDVGRMNFASPGRPQILWKAPNGADLEVAGGRIYWDQSKTDQFPGCLGVSNLDGNDGHCADVSQEQYGPVRADEKSVYFIRDGDIFKMPRQSAGPASGMRPDGAMLNRLRGPGWFSG